MLWHDEHWSIFYSFLFKIAVALFLRDFLGVGPCNLPLQVCENKGKGRQILHKSFLNLPKRMNFQMILGGGGCPHKACSKQLILF